MFKLRGEQKILPACFHLAKHFPFAEAIVPVSTTISMGAEDPIYVIWQLLSKGRTRNETLHIIMVLY